MALVSLSDFQNGSPIIVDRDEIVLVRALTGDESGDRTIVHTERESFIVSETPYEIFAGANVLSASPGPDGADDDCENCMWIVYDDDSDTIMGHSTQHDNAIALAAQFSDVRIIKVRL